MFCIRLLLIALCLCPLAVAQDHSLISGKAGSNVQQLPDFRSPTAASPSEPWRILPKPDSDKDKHVILITPEKGPEDEALLLQAEALAAMTQAAGTTCYAIRSYAVARDSKDSDSVHPVGYSTCIPVTRFRLKPGDDLVR